MGREVVKPGAVRAAAASAAAGAKRTTSATGTSSRGGRKIKKGPKGSSKVQDPIIDEWSRTEEGIALLAKHAACKAAAREAGDKVTDELKAAVAAASKAKRDALELFRAFKKST